MGVILEGYFPDDFYSASLLVQEDIRTRVENDGRTRGDCRRYDPFDCTRHLCNQSFAVYRFPRIPYRQSHSAANAAAGLLRIDEVEVLARTGGLVGVENLGIHRNHVGQDGYFGRDHRGAVDLAQ